MRFSRVVLIVSLLFVASELLLATQYVSVMSGRWTQQTTWNPPGIPRATSDTVIIRHTVRYDAGRTYTVSQVEIQPGGILTATRSFPLNVVYGLRNDGVLRWPRSSSISALDFVNTGTVESMAGATITVRAGSGGLTNSGTMNFSGGSLVIQGNRGLVNSYSGVLALGTGSLTVTGGGDFTNDGILSSTSGSITLPAGMVNKGSLVVQTGKLTLAGSFTNTGTVAMGKNSLLVLTGTGNSAVSSVSALLLGRLSIEKASVYDEVTLNCGLTLSYDGSAGPAVELVRGTLLTNGQSLLVEAGELRGTSDSRLVITGTSAVSLFYLNQSAAFPATVLVSENPSLIIREHQLGGMARFDCGGGEVNYTGTGIQLVLGATSGDGGWYASAGTVSFSGDVLATNNSVFRATGSALVRFVGSAGSSVVLHNSQTGVSSIWDFNKLVVEKTGGTVVFTSGSGALSRSVTVAEGIVVKAGASLTLGGSFSAGKGYVVGSVSNEGSLAQAADIYVSGSWSNTGSYSHGSRQVTFTGTGEYTLTSSGASFYRLTIDKGSGSISLTDALRVVDRLTVNSGTFALGRNVLTLGTSSNAGSVRVNGGKFSAVGTGGTRAKVVAASEGFPYSFAVASGATIAARRAIFQWMDDSGINIGFGATIDSVDNFSSCVLDHGDSPGPMLKIENNQFLTNITNLSFYGTAGSNIEKLTTVGRVVVSYGGGTRWGEDYDSDPNNLVDWVSGARRDVGISAILSPADTVSEKAQVYPQVNVSNYGSTVETFGVRVTIWDNKDGVVFDSVEMVSALGVDETRTFTFSQYYWLAGPQQVFRCLAQTELGPDEDPTNDYVEKNIVVVDEKPASFSLLRPENGQGDRPVTDTLVWSKSLRADGYHVLLDTVNPPVETLVKGYSDTVLVCSGLQDGRVYYWSVIARNPGGRTESEVNSFKTMLAPALPQLSSPMNGALDQGISGILSWVGASRATGYDVYLDTVNPPQVLRSANQVNTSFNYSGLSNDRRYYWKVLARNAGGVSSSGVWSFTTVVARPGSFSLSTPPNGSTGLPLSGLLTWRSAPRAVWYDVYLDRYTHPITKIGWDITDTVLPYTNWVTNDKKYYWRVVAKNAGGATLCNSTFNFRTEPLNTAPDAAVAAIYAPTPGVLDTGTTVIPAVTVANVGPVAFSCKAWFTVVQEGYGPVYRDSCSISELAAGSALPVNFRPWLAPHAVGNYAARCSVYVPSDGNPANDTLGALVQVLLPADYDVGVARINAPGGSLDTSVTVVPRVTVKNYGANRTAFLTFVSFYNQANAKVYEQRVEIEELEPGQSRTLVLPAWPKPYNSGPYSVRCSTYLAYDENPANDLMQGSFAIVDNPIHDVGVSSIFMPAGSVSVGTVVLPAIRVANYESYDAACDLRLTIEQQGRIVYEGYENDVFIPGDDSFVFFFSRPWTASPGGRYSVKAYTVLGTDVVPGNDTLEGSCYVVSQPGWTPAAPMPQTPTPLAPKDGAWLTYHAGKGLVYAAKGNKTVDFYQYDPATDAWTKRCNIPQEEEGKNKPPAKGCVGVTDGGNSIFMVKGNSTLGFWRYDISGDSWQRMPAIPKGAGKKVKGGTDAVYVFHSDTGYIYLLKGGKTEFYRFNIQARRWDTLESVPYSEKPKYDRGSFLVYDGDDNIYAHQAVCNNGTNHFLFRYSISTQSWLRTPLRGMPLAGLEGSGVKQKKSKDGACGTWYGGSIFALKGGNTCQFYRYLAEADTWYELDTVPQLGRGSDKPKKVKAGADIVSVGDGVFYALKGGKSYELWSYTLPVLGASSGGGDAGRTVPAYRMILPRSFLSLSPNPVADGLVSISLSLPQTGLLAIKVHDALGRVVLSQTAALGRERSSIFLDMRGFPAGVYLVRVTTELATYTGKLVVQK